MVSVQMGPQTRLLQNNDTQMIEVVGIAIEQGYFGGVDDLLSDYLPQVASLEEGKRQLKMCIRDRITMSGRCSRIFCTASSPSPASSGSLQSSARQFME